ncbi:hypothetical protein ACAW74_13810 [Fibrella sp. WM1]|uniref:NHL domain-containing protein n=1 Tax=Fibrella musci TaxID=3242485 RepID=UPI0035222738
MNSTSSIIPERQAGPRRHKLPFAWVVFSILLVAGFASTSPGQTIRTIAGSTPVANGGPATDLNLSGVMAVAVDSYHNLYIAGSGWNGVLKVDPNGIATNIPTSYYVKSLASDTNGNIFFGLISGVIQKRAPNGTITTLVTGGPFSSPSGLAVDGLGTIYVSDEAARTIHKIAPNGTITRVAGTGGLGSSGDGGPALNATFNYPQGVAIDSFGNIYVADFNNSRVRKIDLNGIITTIAGTGVEGSGGDGGLATSAQLNKPVGLAFDPAGNLHISDANSLKVRKISQGGTISTVAGTGANGFSGDGGPALNAALDRPFGLAFDQNGSYYFADIYNKRVRRVDGNGLINSVAGGGPLVFSGDGGPAVSARLNRPAAVVVDRQGNKYIADTENQRLRKINANGTISTIAGNGVENPMGTGDGGLAVNAALYRPNDVALDSRGTIYICTGNLIRRVTPDGIISTFAGNNSAGFSGDGGPATNASLNAPAGIAIDKYDNVFIADLGNFRIRKVTPNGLITTIAGNGSPGPTRGGGGDGGPASQASVCPYRVAVDSAGTVYFSHVYSFRFENTHRIRKIGVDGIINTVAGTASANGGFSGDGGPALDAKLFQPQGLVVNQAGEVFFADKSNHRIRKISPQGIINTVAGTTAGLGGDGGLAINAALNAPSDVAGDPSGVLYIADTDNNRIRQVDPEVSIQVLGSSTICSGSSATLVAAGGTSYSWSTGASSESIVVNVAGIYSVTAFSGSQPVGVATKTIYTAGQSTVKAGNWTDPTVWSCGRIPQITDLVLLQHTVSLPTSYTGQAKRLTMTGNGKLVYGLSAQVRTAFQ